ncbi:SGNH/GDSL hydrolase family protein [Mesorhizobium sp. M1252]|uniref:GDSL-type esterase/lipase family protein n=1 Tax=Mesorhizobium sp. M1252 TaxID=2957073 RepID=UPI00333C04BB
MKALQLILMATTSFTPVVAPSQLPAGTLVTFMGDSIMEYNNGVSAGTSNFSVAANNNGEMQQCLALDPRFNIDVWAAADAYDVPYGRGFYGANQGYAGQTSTTVLSRKSNGLSQGAGLYVWAAGTNDGLENASAQTQAIANAQAFANDVIAAGKRLLIIGVRPTGTVQNTPARIAGRKATNVGLAAIATANPGVVYFIDLWAGYDPNGDDIVDVSYQTDGLHPSAAGAYAAATTGGLLAKLQTIIAPGDIMALNPNAELCPAIAGSGGTNGVGANLTGTIPAGWTIEYGSGTTATAVSSVSGGVWTLNVTPGVSASTFRVRPTTNVATVAGTDWLKMSADVQSGGVIVSRLEDNLNTANYYASGFLLDPAVQPIRAKSMTPVWLAKSTAVRPTVRVAAAAGAAAFTATIYGVSCKKQTSPRTQRNAGSVPTISVTPTAPTGTLTVGSVLTANTGTWNNNSGSIAQTLAYRWYRDGVFISQTLGVAATYTLVAADSGKTITCGISAANPAGRSAESISPGVLIA